MLKPHKDNYDVIIAGGGPAGASAAIHLARGGMRVLLIEQKKFPRAKLCGEFISPECQTHFEKLGVAAAMISSGGAATNRSMLNMSANTIEPAAAAVVPVFNSSFGFRCVGTGNKPGTAPVSPAKSPSPCSASRSNRK